MLRPALSSRVLVILSIPAIAFASRRGLRGYEGAGSAGCTSRRSGRSSVADPVRLSYDPDTLAIFGARARLSRRARILSPPRTSSAWPDVLGARVASRCSRRRRLAPTADPGLVSPGRLFVALAASSRRVRAQPSVGPAGAPQPDGAMASAGVRDGPRGVLIAGRDRAFLAACSRSSTTGSVIAAARGFSSTRLGWAFCSGCCAAFGVRCPRRRVDGAVKSIWASRCCGRALLPGRLCATEVFAHRPTCGSRPSRSARRPRWLLGAIGCVPRRGPRVRKGRSRGGDRRVRRVGLE